MSKGFIIRSGILIAVVLAIFIDFYSIRIGEQLSSEPTNVSYLNKQKAESDIVVMKAFSGQTISDAN